MKNLKLLDTILNPIKTMFRKLFCDILLIADNRPTVYEKVEYFFTIIAAFGPIAYLLNAFNFWFETNKQFASFIIIAIVVNMIVGIVFHLKMKTFSWELFIKRNSLMIGVVLVVYLLLEQLRITIGENYAGEGFKVVIQVSTLLYPSSKAFKNIYILSNKQFPPAFIMDRLYNFEKSGNLKDLFPDKKEEE